MADTKILRAIINGQSSMKTELLSEIKKVNGRLDNLEKKMDNGFKNVNNRLDSIGKSVAYLEDDAPTGEEHDKLEKRVAKIEKKVAII